VHPCLKPFGSGRCISKNSLFLLSVRFLCATDLRATIVGQDGVAISR
jgi:hypothetical protein